MDFLFDNTELAFAGKSNKELKKAKLLFQFMAYPSLVKTGKILLNFALRVGFPVKWIIKPTVFRHFCGGETLQESMKTIENLAKSNIKSIPDFSAEAGKSDADFENLVKEVSDVIELASTNFNVPFAVFKPSGLCNVIVLQKKSAEEKLTDEEISEYEKFVFRFDALCRKAAEKSIPVFVDAEESWIQKAVDDVCLEMMKIYNREKAIVFNTLQMYRTDRLDYLKFLEQQSKKENFYIGLKLVRGAYIEKERQRALKYNYTSPIYASKHETDAAYNNAVEFCFEHSDRISFCCATHNELSCALLAELICRNNFNTADKRFWFAQLYGMSDHISYNLAHKGFNVCKYLPYGPVKSVMPYLIRRAEENTSVAGQTGRELQLIKKELQRRKSHKPFSE